MTFYPNSYNNDNLASNLLASFSLVLFFMKKLKITEHSQQAGKNSLLRCTLKWHIEYPGGKCRKGC